MRKVLAIIMILLLAISILGVVSAQDEELQSSGINPTSKLWGIDKALEQLRYKLTFGANMKAQYGLKIAEERLTEIRVMNLLNNSVGVQLAEQERTKIINRFEQDALKVESTQRTMLQERLQTHLQSQEQVRSELSLENRIQLQENQEIVTRLQSGVQNGQ